MIVLNEIKIPKEKTFANIDKKLQINKRILKNRYMTIKSYLDQYAFLLQVDIYQASCF